MVYKIGLFLIDKFMFGSFFEVVCVILVFVLLQGILLRLASGLFTCKDCYKNDDVEKDIK